MEHREKGYVPILGKGQASKACLLMLQSKLDSCVTMEATTKSSGSGPIQSLLDTIDMVVKFYNLLKIC
jgi:hypothetical protein